MLLVLNALSTEAQINKTADDSGGQGYPAPSVRLDLPRSRDVRSDQICIMGLISPLPVRGALTQPAPRQSDCGDTDARTR